MNKTTCKGCARLVQFVNTEVKYCVEDTGVMYLVNHDWYESNDCEEKCETFTLKGVDWK